MSRWCHHIVIVICIATLLCCASSQSGERNEQGIFFDIAAFVDSFPDEMIHSVNKSITVDGIAEIQTLENYDLARDIQSFESYSINKPALYDKYAVDSVTNDEGILEELVYHALEEGLKVQLMHVNFDHSEARQIMLKLHTDSFLENVEMEVDWIIDSGYEITRRVQRIFGPEHIHEIRVSIQP